MIELSELRDAAQKAFSPDQLTLDRDLAWSRIAEQGWMLIELPEALGGLGLGRDASATIQFELGRVLNRAPLIPALLGLQGVAASATLTNREDWIERICAGTYIPLNMLPAAVEHAADGAMTGRISGVFEADMASHVLVGLANRYLLVPLDAAGVTVRERPVWDQSRRLFDVTLDGYQPDPTLIVAEGDAAKDMHDRISPLAQLALAADSLGGASRALEMTVEYLAMRKQFDRPLAMFQSLKHRCADLKTRIVAAEALLWSRAADPAAAVVDFGALKALANSVYTAVTEDMIQLHGGIGLTEEHHCHLFLKRALLNQHLCGSTDHWNGAAGRAAFARLIAA